jgi:diguanylate cyclase (GGDEF)-like protein
MSKPSALDARDEKRIARVAPQPPAGAPKPSAGTIHPLGPGADQLLKGSARLPRDSRRAVAALSDEIEYLRHALAEAYRQIAHLENLADMDSLVPAFNRRAFMRQLSRTIAFGDRYDTVNSVVYIDINGMKQINDALGHSAGDAALTRVVEVLNERVRQSDVVGRLGGDEFGIILVQTDNATAWQKVSELGRAIADTPLVWEDDRVTLHAAFGVHTIQPGDDAHTALFTADQSMYLDKKNARRRRAYGEKAALTR